MTPITRIEKLINAIVESEASPFSAVTRIESYLTDILNNTTSTLAPVTPVETYLAKISGADVAIPAPVTRIEMYLAAIAGEDIETPIPVTHLEYFLADWAETGSASLETVTGNAPLTLLKAVARAIVSLTQTGLCAQASTPTPSTPVDIVCNNGALKMVDDELPDGYKRVLGFNCNNNAMWQITGFKLRGSDTVRVSFSVTAACNVWGCYQSTSATDNYDLYATTTAGGKYFRYGNGTYDSYFSSENQDKRFDVVYTPSGSIGMPNDSTWTPATFESANDLLLGSTTVGGTSSKLKGNLYGDFIVENGGVERLHLVPCERISDNVLGYYDLVGEAFYEPYTGYDGAVSLGYDGSHYVLQTVGTPEVLTVTDENSNTQTASVVNLLSVGNYADTQELISGAVARKCGIAILTGQENIGTSNACFTIPISDRVTSKTALLCSHFPYSNKTSSQTEDETIISFSSTNIGFRYDACADKVAFAAWLAAQYAIGTPVIVVYPLAEETSEQETPQTLTTSDGTNTVSVVANVGPVSLECEYYKAPQAYMSNLV